MKQSFRECKSNKVQVNYKSRTQSSVTYHLFIDDEQLEWVTNTKLLELVIDQHINWKCWLDLDRKKISSGLYIMNGPKRYLSSEHQKIFYYSLMHPYVLYGNILWGNTYKTQIHKLEILQKRQSESLQNRHSVNIPQPLFNIQKILKLGDLHDLQICSFIYDFVNSIPLLWVSWSQD